MTTSENRLQALLNNKQNNLAELLGVSEAERIMERSLKLVKQGKKSLTDILSIEEIESLSL